MDDRKANPLAKAPQTFSFGGHFAAQAAVTLKKAD